MSLLLPKGVIEITPHLYLGPESAVQEVLLKHKCRHILRVTSENRDYNAILKAERDAREPWMRGGDKARKNSPQDKKRQEDELDDEDEEGATEKADEKKAELDATVGEGGEACHRQGGSKKSQRSSTVEELSDEGAASTAERGGETPACHKCGLPTAVVDDQGNSEEQRRKAAVKEEEEDVYSKEEIDYQYLSVQVRSHFCPMEDDMQFDISKGIAKAVDWLGRTLGELGGDGDIPHFNRLGEEEGEGDDVEEEEAIAADIAEETTAAGAEQEDNTSSATDVQADPNCSAATCRVTGGTTGDDGRTGDRRMMMRPDEPMDMSKAVYLHCYAGASCSPTVLLAYLMARKEFPLQKAVDEYLPLSCRPNPSFIQQLMMLEEMFFGEPSNFDVQTYNLDGLGEMFQNVSRDQCEEVLLNKCRGNVIDARSALMKVEMQALNRERLMIQALMTSAGSLVKEVDAEKCWRESGKNRDQALYALMKVQAQKLAAIN